MLLKDFMSENYPNLPLRLPLFYNWNIGIRFELGVGWKNTYKYPYTPYITDCYKRVITIFETIHSPMDDIFVVIDVNDFNNGKNLKQQLKNFRRYVKKSLLYNLKYEELPYIYPEDDEKGIYKTHRFTLKCKTSDFKYIPLLKAICNHELGLTPLIYHRVYFININRKTIFNVYDDRGCDLLATSPDIIRNVYHKHNDWILDYDRVEIDKVFN